MATRLRPDTPAKDLHDQDFYVWAEAQAALLRARRFEPLLLSPLLLVASGAYCWGLATGAARWLRRAEGEPGERPRWE